MQETDEVLYVRFVSEGDSSALDTLLERYAGSLTLFLRGYTTCMEDAEDLMMDTFVVLATKKVWVYKGSSFKTWLFAIGRKLALAHHRKYGRILHMPEGGDADEIDRYSRASMDPDEHPEQRLLRQEENRQLYLAIEKLPAQYREALYLLYFQQMSYEEACEIMKKSRKQMYHLAERGREALREELEKMGFEPRWQ